MVNKIYITFTEITHRCKQLAEEIMKSDGRPDMILAVARGGLVPAGMLAQLLDVRDIRTICLASYSDDGQQEEIKPIFCSDIPVDKNVLVVDDLIDSGGTLAYLKEKFKAYNTVKFATFYSKTANLNKLSLLDYATELKNPDEWIVFPWEPEAL